LAYGARVDGTPAAAGFVMPAEWERHERTWMAWPPLESYLRDDGHGAGIAWAGVANAVVAFEPVTMLVPPDAADEAAALLDARVERITCPLDDAWFRDTGPTFLLDEHGRLGAALWQFNGWGQQPWSRWEQDLAARDVVAARTRAIGRRSTLVNEGGAICVDGVGTVLVTDTVQLDPLRNPGWTRADVEDELRTALGVTTVIWLARGLTGDMQGYGTKGHVDLLAAFVEPGVVVVHRQPDLSHPDHEVMTENVGRLRAARDARGRPLDLVEVDAPHNRWEAGVPLDCSYINFAFVNGGAVLCGFDDPLADAAALATFARLLPGRRLVQVPALDLFRKGGGVHCITQQQPALLR
jgi:agmatine deiminase